MHEEGMLQGLLHHCCGNHQSTLTDVRDWWESDVRTLGMSKKGFLHVSPGPCPLPASLCSLVTMLASASAARYSIASVTFVAAHTEAPRPTPGKMYMLLHWLGVIGVARPGT